MIDALPPGWTTAQLGDLLQRIDTGKNIRCIERPPDANERGIVKISAVSWGTFQEAESKTVPSGTELDERARISAGDLLISRANTIELVGAAVRVQSIQKALYLSDKVLRLRADDQIIPWIHRALTTPGARRAIGDASSGNQLSMRNISQDALKALPIPLAPLAEQKRITDKLEALSAKLTACRERLDRVPTILKHFRKSVLHDATTGQLTTDWRVANPCTTSNAAADWLRDQIELRRENSQNQRAFKDPVEPDMTHWNVDVPSTWSVSSVSSFAECLDSRRVPVTKSARKSAKKLYPYYGANGIVDMVDDFLFDDELVLVTEDETFYGREKPIAYRVSGKCWVNNHAHVLRAPDKTAADYLCYSLAHYNVLPWLTGTTGRAKLTQGVLNSLPIAIPAPPEQAEIVRRVDELFALADALERRYETAKAHVEKLMPTILAKAFRGELVPQDPNDEPASVLLERIRMAGERANTASGRPRSALGR